MRLRKDVAADLPLLTLADVLSNGCQSREPHKPGGTRTDT
jgi:hypothetical protein